jgi:hypothetical protein
VWLVKFGHGLVQFALVQCLLIRVYVDRFGLLQHSYVDPPQTPVLWVTPIRKSGWPSLLTITQIIQTMASALYHAGANLSSIDIIPLHGEVSLYILRCW